MADIEIRYQFHAKSTDCDQIALCGAFSFHLSKELQTWLLLYVVIVHR